MTSRGPLTIPLVSSQPSYRLTEDEPPWIFWLAPREPRRLVVFVHGFRGTAIKTWKGFPRSGEAGEWWCESDLLFVSYDSIHESIESAAFTLRERLPDFYPHPPRHILEGKAGEPALLERSRYTELYLVGHSLGGVVIRRMMADSAQLWQERLTKGTTGTPPPPLNAALRLFSPATAGFQPAGGLGVFHASRAWAWVEMFLRRSPAYSDLQPGSVLLTETKERTEGFVKADEQAFAALRAYIVWADKEEVVVSSRYHTDHVAAVAKGQSHKSVCKPHAGYKLPWHFVETGTVPRQEAKRRRA